MLRHLISIVWILTRVLSADYPMPFYSDTAKKLKGLAPDLTQGVGMAPLPPTALPPCYDHAYSDPASVSSGHKSSVGVVGSMYEEHYSAPASGGGPSGSATPASEHHYDVPHLRPSHDSPAPSEACHLLPSRALATPTLDGSVGSRCLDSPMSSLEKPPRSDSPASLSSNATSSEYLLRRSPRSTYIFSEKKKCWKRKRLNTFSFS